MKRIIRQWLCAHNRVTPITKTITQIGIFNLKKREFSHFDTVEIIHVNKCDYCDKLLERKLHSLNN